MDSKDALSLLSTCNKLAWQVIESMRLTFEAIHDAYISAYDGPRTDLLILSDKDVSTRQLSAHDSRLICGNVCQLSDSKFELCSAFIPVADAFLETTYVPVSFQGSEAACYHLVVVDLADAFMSELSELVLKYSSCDPDGHRKAEVSGSLWFDPPSLTYQEGIQTMPWAEVKPILACCSFNYRKHITDLMPLVRGEFLRARRLLDPTPGIGGASPTLIMTSLEREVWDALEGCQLKSPAIAEKIRLEKNNADAIRMRILGMRRKNIKIEHTPAGYYRPDSPPSSVN